MPPKATKQKSASKDGEKNKKKNSAVDDTESPVIIDEPPVATTATPTVDLITEEVKPEEIAVVEEVDVKYEEPVLTLIIVERYSHYKTIEIQGLFFINEFEC